MLRVGNDKVKVVRKQYRGQGKYIEEINIEFGESSYGKEKYSEDELYWMGYLYRYWSYTHQKTASKYIRLLNRKNFAHYTTHTTRLIRRKPSKEF